MIPAAVTSGYSTNESAAVLAIDNPLCGPSVGTSSGWKLKAITNAAAGLPNTLTPPLTLVTS